MAFDLLHKDVDQIRFFKEELTSYYDDHAKSERLKNFLVVLRDLEQSNYSSLPHSSEFPSSVEYRCAAETRSYRVLYKAHTCKGCGLLLCARLYLFLCNKSILSFFYNRS